MPKSVTKDRFVDVACGFGHCLALTETGRVYTWGINMKGQLGLGDIKPRYQPSEMELANGHAIAKVYASDNSSACITEQGTLYTWGSGRYHRLMQDSSLSIVTSPTVVSKVLDVMIESFSFARKQSTALIFTRLLKVQFIESAMPSKLILYVCSYHLLMVPRRPSVAWNYTAVAFGIAILSLSGSLKSQTCPPCRDRHTGSTCGRE